MRFMQFLVETTEEDRAIISLSEVMYKRLAAKHGETVDLGTIGDMFDTPIVALNDVRIMLVSDEDMRKVAMKLFGRPSGSRGVWAPEENTIYINSSHLDKSSAKSTISHELRHALDDVKSNYRAGDSYGYNTAPDDRDQYKGQPAEINARFAEVMHYLTAYMAQQNQLGTLNRDDVVTRLYELMEKKQISTMFPEKTQSKAYKRLLKRAMDFVTKEIAYRQSRKGTK